MAGKPEPETLVRYLDGELDEIAAAETDARIREDPELARVADELRRSAMLLHAAFAEPLREPLPAHLRGVVDAGIAPRRRRRIFGRSGGLGWGAAVAASSAALLLGVLGGYLAGTGAGVAPGGALTALSGQEITVALVGNTIVGAGKVSAYSIYYQGPGELRARSYGTAIPRPTVAYGR